MKTAAAEVYLLKRLNIMGFLAFIIATQPITACAGLTQLAQEFLKVNVQVSKNQAQWDLSKLQIPALEAQNSLFLKGQTGYDHSSLKGQLGLKESYTKKLSFIVGKTFSTGTSISIENNLLDNDQRRAQGVAEFLGIQNRFYEFQNVLNVSQDLGENILGFRFRKELELAKMQEKLTKVTTTVADQGLLLDFYNEYIHAKLNKSLIRFQQEGLTRALKRQEVIAKRVHDGILEKVDLYKTKILVLSQKENLAKARQEFKTSLNELSQRLHRKVDEDEIEAYQPENYKVADVIKGDLKDNKESLALEKNKEYIAETIKKIRFGYIPNINLTALYKTNSNEPDWQKAVNRGRFGRGNKEVGVLLSVTVPLGFEATKTQEQKEQIQKMVKEHEHRVHLENIKSLEESLKTNIETIIANINSSLEKRKVAIDSLNETIRLYNLGRTSIDSVILSEEELIKTEASFASYLASFDGTQGLLGNLYGKLENFLLGKT